jgi:D-glycero-alpha-D-manno-heptose-7-phosphate kinase
MIICQTPLRISFFGGGTDFPEFFSQDRGAVLATGIDKYIYHSVSAFPSALFDYKIRLAYRKVECVKQVSQIQHKPFREVLKALGIEGDVEINLSADLPAYSGLGSSSSFTVGLINALMAYQGQFISQTDLAYRAIEMERQVLREYVGCQDQVLAAFGGLNLIQFYGEENIVVSRIPLSRSRITELDESLLLYFTGFTRKAHDMEKLKLERLDQNQKHLHKILDFVDQGYQVLSGGNPLCEFGELLHHTWMEKKQLDPGVTNPEINRMYENARRAGALGGKLLGAGGGGFMLFFVPPEIQGKFRSLMAGYVEVPFHINAPGSRIIHSS